MTAATDRLRALGRATLTAVKAGWRPMWRRAVPQLLPAAALWLALVLVRHRLIGELGLTYAQAFDTGLLLGWLFDFWAVLLAAAVAQFVAASSPVAARFVWPLSAFLVWFANVANLSHYRFFGSRLDWWTVSLHWRDVATVSDSAAQLSSNVPVILSLFLLVAGGVVTVLAPRLFRAWLSQDPEPPSFWLRRRRALVQAVLLVAAVGAVHRLPAWLRFQQTTTMVSGNITHVWLRQLTSKSLYAGAGTAWTADLKDAKEIEPEGPGRQLARYRDLALEPPKLPGPTLYRELSADPEESKSLRRRLGLPQEGPIHVVMLFLESVRAFELYHPEFGPEIYPEFRRVLANHAIDFRQAYSSSFTAGQTVRGQFSTLCSMLPNITGAAAYIAHNTLDVRCLQQLLKENGYLTTWMNTFRSSFHGKRTFEMTHGTDLFFDGDAFRERGISKKFHGWGLADVPFLEQVVAIFEELSHDGKPVFINALTISVHHPYRDIPDGKLSDEMIAAAGTKHYYRSYLTGLRYEDIAIGGFFDRLFQSPMADRTLVVALADHGSAVSPNVPLSLQQTAELRFRVPIALITRNNPTPEVITRPVHQVDVAPTVARILGIRGAVTWVGRGLLQERGSPWVYEEKGEVSYRFGNRACYAFHDQPRTCWDLSGRDPLYDPIDTPIDEDPALTAFFADTIRANFRAIALNLVR